MTGSSGVFAVIFQAFAQGGEVILRGTVRSWAEREEAERAAWRAPGVVKVDNQIVVKVDDLASVAA